MRHTGFTPAGHVLVACDKFKGSLTALEVAEHIREGLARGAPHVPLRTVPVADGGDGTLQSLLAAGFTAVPVAASGPTGKLVASSYVTRGPTAVVELADVCGLVRLPKGEPAPLEASSYGVGEVLREALDRGHREIVLAVGGSASSDGGAGMVSALGALLLDRDGQELPSGGGALEHLASLDLSALHPGVREARIVVASDVDNPLLGPSGAVAVYGPQKGATGEAALRLERGLTRWARTVERTTGRSLAGAAGAGAAGGVGLAAMAILGAQMRPGIELLLDLVRFADHLDGARLVVTGEGSLDAQTLQGKTPVGVARIAQQHRIPVVALCGRSTLSPAQARSAGIDRIFSLLDLEPDLRRCLDDAGPLLTRLANEMASALLAESR